MLLFNFFFKKIDIDECLINNGGCHKDAICTNIPGSFTCTCKPEFAGTGFSCSGLDFFIFLFWK